MEQEKNDENVICYGTSISDWYRSDAKTKTQKLIDSLADASITKDEGLHHDVITMIYEQMSRMHNTLISIDVAIDKIYTNDAPKPLQLLRPIIKEII